MVYWASVLAALCWLYATLASLWPILFARDFVKASQPDPMGYRIGLWKVHWRLPARAAILVVLLSMVPILVVIFLDGWFVTVILIIMTGITLLLWMSAPPGMIIGFRDAGQKGDHLLLEPESQRDISRAILILLLFGLLPALGIGAILKWTLTRFVV